MEHPEEVEDAPQLVATAQELTRRRRKVEGWLVPAVELGPPQRRLAAPDLARNLRYQIEALQPFWPGKPMLGEPADLAPGRRRQPLSIPSVKQQLAGLSFGDVDGAADQPGETNLLRIRWRSAPRPA